jgi:hypothetical protein
VYKIDKIVNLEREVTVTHPKAVLFCFMLSLLTAGMLAQSVYSKDIELSAPRVAQAIKMDGKRADWSDSSITFLKDQEASVGLCTDSQNLYVMLSFRKPQYARLIRMSGLTLYFDPEGKDHKDFWVKFTGGPTMEEIRQASGQSDDSAQRQMSPEAMERMNERDQNYENQFLCYQKDRISEKPIPMNGSEGPAVAFGVDEGFFVYEFRVPLKESSVRFYGLDAAPGRDVSVGMVWGEFDRSAMREMRGDDDGMGHGGIGGMPGGVPGGMGEGGRRHGGGGGFPGGGRQGREMPKKQEVWLKARLTSSGGNGSSELHGG